MKKYIITMIAALFFTGCSSFQNVETSMNDELLQDSSLTNTAELSIDAKEEETNTTTVVEEFIACPDVCVTPHYSYNDDSGVVELYITNNSDQAVLSLEISYVLFDSKDLPLSTNCETYLAESVNISPKESKTVSFEVDMNNALSISATVSGVTYRDLSTYESENLDLWMNDTMKSFSYDTYRRALLDFVKSEESPISKNVANGEFEIGEVISFGDNEWVVLDKDDHSAFIISKDTVLYVKNTLYSDEWAKCPFRRYLNGEYYDSFNVFEKSMIIPTYNVNTNVKPGIYDAQSRENWEFEPIPQDDTLDKIFLLSYDEVLDYKDILMNNKTVQSKSWVLRTKVMVANKYDYYDCCIGDDNVTYDCGLKHSYVRPALTIMF